MSKWLLLGMDGNTECFFGIAWQREMLPVELEAVLPRGGKGSY